MVRVLYELTGYKTFYHYNKLEFMETRGRHVLPSRLNDEHIVSYKIVTPAPKLLKVGDKVEILEIASELPEWEIHKQHFDESAIFTVKNVWFDGYILEGIDHITNDFSMPFHVVSKVEDK